MRLPRQAFDEDGELITKAKKGLCEYFNVKTFEECPEEYRKRLEFELQLMVKKGIARYFLVLMDILNWCDANKISHGIARGSAGGSLVSMCLGVTGKIMDPVKNGLLFERFISNERLVDCYIDYSKKGNE
jgi:DNA polymerase-3 subunit alpha